MSSIFRNSVTFEDDTVEIPDIEFEPISIVADDEIVDAKQLATENKIYIDGFDMTDFSDEHRQRVGAFLQRRLKEIDEQSEAVLENTRRLAKEQAEQQAKQIVEASEKHRDEIVRHAQMQTSEIFEKARNQGAKAGREEKSAEIADSLAGVEDTLREMKRLQNERFEEFDTQLKWLALEIAQKLVYKKIDEDDLFLHELVTGAIKEAKEAQWLNVTLSDKLEGLLENLREEYSQTDMKIEFDKDENMKKGDVVINGSDRQVIASVDEQIKNISEYFSSFEEFK